MAARIRLGCFICFSRKPLQFLLPNWLQSSDAWSWPVATPCVGEMRTSQRSPQVLHHLMPASIDQSLLPLLSKIFELVNSGRLSPYPEHSRLIPTNKFAYRKNLGITDELFCISHKVQQALDRRHEARVVQLDFSAAFHRVSHAGLLRKLETFGVGGPVLSILTQFLTDLTHRVCVDKC